MRRSKVIRLRRLIEAAMNGRLPDEQALESAELFPQWDSNARYEMEQRVRYGALLYCCLQSHDAQENWNPEDAASLWARILSEEVNWVQPDSTNPYGKGDQVVHNGKNWVSIVDHNIWEPGVYGWEELQ